MLKDFFKNIFYQNKIALPNEMDKIFSFLSSVTHHPDTIENYLFQYNKIKRSLKSSSKDKLINLYLNWEEFIVNTKTETFKIYTKESLRDAIKKEVDIRNLDEEFRIIFLNKKEQSVAIYEYFINQLVDYVNQQLGNATLVKTVKDLRDPFLAKIRLTSNGLDFSLINQSILNDVQYPIDEITKSFKNLVGAMYSRIELSLGEKLTKDTFNTMFNNFKEKYNAELASVVLKIIPERILGMDEWLSLMSKKELEKQVREKTEELISLNNSLEKTVSERTAELKVAYENLKKLDDKKSEFISVAAHQLRTPLSAVKWGLSMLQNGEIGTLTKEQKEFLEKNINSNNKVIEIVNELLDIDLYTKDEQEYHFASADISKIISDVIESVASLSKKRNIQIDWNEPKEKMNAEIDHKKIAIVLQNLIDNAIKYGNANSTIKIEVRKINTMINISVKNKGIGIPEEEADDIFERFFRAKNAVRKETEGMGIGLFITKNIVEDHGGRIWFESKKDGETTFSVEIPISKKIGL